MPVSPCQHPKWMGWNWCLDSGALTSLYTKAVFYNVKCQMSNVKCQKSRRKVDMRGYARLIDEHFTFAHKQEKLIPCSVKFNSRFYQKWRTSIVVSYQKLLTNNDGKPDEQQQTSKNSLTLLQLVRVPNILLLFCVKSQPQLLTKKNSKMFTGCPISQWDLIFHFPGTFDTIR